MAEAKAEARKPSGLEEINSITEYISEECWDFKRICNSEGHFLEIDMFNGIVRLYSDGTWTYKE